MAEQEALAEMIGGKDRMIGELYSRCRGLEEAYKKLVKERDALAKELERIKTAKQEKSS